jgi:DNA topoisomerase IA
MARVYDLVVRHFISSISEDAVWRSTKISFEVEGLGEKGKFYLAGKEVSFTNLIII